MIFPRVSAVIMAWSPRQRPYLDLLIRSLLALNYPQDRLDIVIVAPSSYAKQITYCDEGICDENIRVRSPEDEQFTAAQGYNFGFRHCSPKTEYYWQLNDDVCVTRDSLAQLVATAQSLDNKRSIVNGISPCDRGVTSILDFPIRKDGTDYLFDQQYARLEQVEHLIPEMLTAKSAYPPGLIVMPWLCGYASLISRALYEVLGDIDEAYENGPDDIDYCYRALAADGVCIMDLHALIWHFGEVTKQADGTMPVKRWLRNVDYFTRKWGRLPPGITANRYNFTLAGLQP